MNLHSPYRDAALLRAALRRLSRFTAETTARHGLTPRRYELLLFIQADDDEGKPATVTSLQGPLQTTQGNVTQLVTAAERAGLVERSSVPADARSHHLHLTPAALVKVRRIHAELGAERERFLDALAELRADSEG
jgi:DNA-binding MarR family transcriptional regulator